MHWREPLASLASWISADYLDFQLSFSPSSPTVTCQECLLSPDGSLLGEVSYAWSNLPAWGLDSAPCRPVTVMILLASESEYCLSAGHWHLPETHLSWVTLDHRLEAESPHRSQEIKGHSVLPSSRCTSLSHQGPITGTFNASSSALTRVR